MKSTTDRSQRENWEREGYIDRRVLICTCIPPPRVPLHVSMETVLQQVVVMDMPSTVQTIPRVLLS
jgi:hypothetical protein